MCGRLVVASPREVLASWLGAIPVEPDRSAPSWNVAPGAQVPVVAAARGARLLGTMRWGLVPSWCPDPLRTARPINARAETLAERPVFAGGLEGRRCVVPVDGFYEWRRSGGVARRHHLTAADGSMLALAAIWDRPTGPGADGMSTFAIVTTAANADVAPLHDRMPVVLSRDDCEPWLDPAVRHADDLASLLRPSPAGTLAVREVSMRVNAVGNDGPDLLQPPEEARLPFPS